MRQNPFSSVVSIAVVAAVASTIACNAFADVDLTLPAGFSATVAQEGLGATFFFSLPA